MKNNFYHKIYYIMRAFSWVVTFFCIVVLGACSVKKNNSATRSYHYTKAKYNVMFNGKEAFRSGMEAIHKASVPLDNYNEILPVFEMSNHDAVRGASGMMDRAIEKSEKTISLHSIVKKPKKNPKKSNDPKYKAFMAKEEYNSQVQEAWLLRGKALYCKLDFAAAEANFAYIMRHYKDNIKVCTEASLWAAMGYTEQGWYYEAEDILNRLSEKSFDPKSTMLYVLVKADLLIRTGRLAESIPFLDTAIEEWGGNEKNRCMFIKAQVLEHLGRYGEAYALYQQVSDRHTEYIMEFNAVLGMARCYQGKSMEPILKETDRLIKRASNEQYMDQIYYTLGKLYMRNGNKQTAMEYYQKAIDSSTRDGIDKAQALLALGEIYYDDEDYIAAQPLYAEAVNIVPNSYSNYKQIQARSINLDYVAKYAGTITLQDSLQALAAMPEDKRVEKLKEVIEAKHKADEEAQKRLEAEARQAEARERSANMAAAAGLSLGESLDKSWYFYNSTLISRGKLDFQKEWGGRTLEDDWRRANKVSFGFFDPTLSEDADEMAENGDSATVAPVATVNPVKDLFTSTGDAELDSYIRTLPLTEEAKRASDDAIEESLYNLYYVYENRIGNNRLATETFDELKRRFPDSQYGMVNDRADDKMEQEAERLYREAYAAFKSGNSSEVSSYLAQAERCCSESLLMPKFYMIEALSSGKSDGKVMFKQKLSGIVERYPDSEVAPLARDMIALVGQGREVVNASPVATITSQREAIIVSQAEYADAIQRAGFEYNPNDSHLFILVIEGDENQKNRALYAMASYNFTRFMIKDFDFKVKELEDSLYAISVYPLSSLDEAVWYQNSLLDDGGVKAALDGVAYQAFVISSDNYIKVFDKESMLKYIEFYRSNNLQVKESEVIRQMEEESGYVK